MDTWIDIRRKARQCHEESLRRAGGDRRADALVQAALKIDDLELRMFDPGTTFAKGVYGMLERSYGIVNVARGQDPADHAVVIAHEIGHNRLHDDPTSEVTVRTLGLGGDPVDSGAGKVEGYSPRERKETQADIFAGEFLCPSDWVRDEVLQRRCRPTEIASKLGIPLPLVTNQFIRALLLPPLRPAEPKPARADYDLDQSQQIAATWNGAPLLVDAGPGTGKTRTLVRRIQNLLETGSNPASILALTFSTKAAEEMRERLSSLDTNAAIQMWVGTFHAFGLEIVTKWPSRVGRTGKLRVLDQAGSLALLEDNLAALPLHHYQNLYEPAYDLVNVLCAISRCKDELILPQEYLAKAKAALASATDGDDRTNAEKAIEVAEIYAVYQEALAKADAVDFGDLIMLAGQLVRDHPGVKTHVSGFTHILVDEYQDVNRASAHLLRDMCGPKTDLWVVADQRQSIYRFRGAEPSNVTSFMLDFAGARHSLGTNYRSFAPIVRLFQTFSGSMGAKRAMAGSCTANRGTGGEVSLTIAPTLAAEAEAIRDKAERFRADGVPYRDQVILARTHLTLSRITSVLEQLGLPLLYLGDLFERDEIRDLLSLVAIDAERGGIGLVRVATLPSYQATRQDSLTVIRWAKTNRVKLFDALTRIPEIDALSDKGRAGLSKLGTELHGLTYASPWILLSTWLFERSDYLWPLLAAQDTKSKQKLLAIYHLLKVCGEQVVMGDPSRKRFLNRIRRIEALNQDNSYRAVASEATDIDAVRVMTIHGSKGLEFGAVHFPALATRYTPVSRQPNRCPPPPSLAHLAMQANHHDAEEECLFFVGLSRARNYLSLSRAERYTTQNATPSRFLVPIATTVRSTIYRGSGKSFALPVRYVPPGARDRYEEVELSLYMQCPARYRYEVLEGLRDAREGSAYIRFHRCVYTTVRWLEEERATGQTVTDPAALARLDAEWKTAGPVDHPFEEFYLKQARLMVSEMTAAIATEVAQYDRQEWAIPLDGRLVVTTPDRVLLTPQGTVRVQTIRTGRETKTESAKPIYALLRRGARMRYPGKKVTIETFYLATGKTILVDDDQDDKSIQHYADAILAIEEGAFEPTPNPRTCPNCQCYFICGS